MSTRPKPMFPKRELYAPGHFGNSYELAGRFEMREILEEAKWWGFNWYCDWFDTANLTKESYLQVIASQLWLKKAVWENKKCHFAEAQNLGFKLDLCISPNHVFVDQCRKDLLATQSSRIIPIHGHLLCPSIPQARKIILGNYNDWFKDLSRSGIKLSALTAFAYDFGGCGCEKCHPWALTFVKLCREIHKIAAGYFRGIEMRFNGWFWKPEEHNQIAAWADKFAPGWVKGMVLWIKYGEERPASVPPGRLPQGCKANYFVHIGYADSREKMSDLYGQWGPTIAPGRIPTTLKTLAALGGEMITAYSEGVFDDVNKALLAGICSGKFTSARDVLEAYAERYFGAKSDRRKKWAEWLFQWGDPFNVDLKTARKTFDHLAAHAPDTWRRNHLAAKLRLFELNKAIGLKGKWSPARLARAEEFFREKEKLKRKIYGLAPIEEAFVTITGLPAWYHKGLQKYAPPTGKRINAEA